jgi:hypothetical protein
VRTGHTEPFCGSGAEKKTHCGKGKKILRSRMHEKTLREKKNNFAWETLRYTNFAFNEQTTCAGNLAPLTRKK